MISSKIALLLMLVNGSSYILVNASKYNPYICSTDYSAVFVVRSRKTGELFTTYYHSANKLEIKSEDYKRVTKDRYFWQILCKGNDSYIIFLRSKKLYSWERDGGCDKNNAPILALNTKVFHELYFNDRRFTYNNKTKMITVCDNKCLYVEPVDGVVRSMSDCSQKEDRFFDIIRIVTNDYTEE
uniref:Uncharacterized protein LOC114330712 n=1 Tax=Diabrotica virgifera virgifera TaxID=50390 RepID=A0A6P7FIK3_DIAVI